MLNDFNRGKKAGKQAERVKNFVKDLIMDLNNMLTKFYWLKERKQKRHEEMTPDPVNGMVNFTHFVKFLTEKVHSVLGYFQKSPTFAEKIDGEMKDSEARIKAEIKKNNEVLEELPDTLAIRTGKYANTLSEAIREFFTQRRFSILKTKQLMHTQQPEKQPYNNKEEISTLVANSPDKDMENLVYSSSEISTEHKNVKSK